MSFIIYCHFLTYTKAQKSLIVIRVHKISEEKSTQVSLYFPLNVFGI